MAPNLRVALMCVEVQCPMANMEVKIQLLAQLTSEHRLVVGWVPTCPSLQAAKRFRLTLVERISYTLQGPSAVPGQDETKRSVLTVLPTEHRRFMIKLGLRQNLHCYSHCGVRSE